MALVGMVTNDGLLPIKTMCRKLSTFRICAENLLFLLVSLKHFLKSFLCNFHFLYKYKTYKQTQLKSRRVRPHSFLPRHLNLYL